MPERRRVIVGISGASGAVYAVRLLQALAQQADVEVHAVASEGGWHNLLLETGLRRHDMAPLAHQWHDLRHMSACIASGSWTAQAMVVAPCSMRTLAAIATGLGDNLLTRAADVTLKERRRLVLLPRETPLHLGHLRHMVSVTEMGAIVCPPMPAFYLRPQSVEDIVAPTVARVLDLIGLPDPDTVRWQGESPMPPHASP